MAPRTFRHPISTRSPAGLPGGRDVTEMVHFADWLPTDRAEAAGRMLRDWLPERRRSASHSEQPTPVFLYGIGCQVCNDPTETAYVIPLNSRRESLPSEPTTLLN